MITHREILRNQFFLENIPIFANFPLSLPFPPIFTSILREVRGGGNCLLYPTPQYVPDHEYLYFQAEKGDQGEGDDVEARLCGSLQPHLPQGEGVAGASSKYLLLLFTM